MTRTRLAALLIAALAPFALLASVRGQQPPASGYTWEIVDLEVDGSQGLLDMREVSMGQTRIRRDLGVDAEGGLHIVYAPTDRPDVTLEYLYRSGPQRITETVPGAASLFPLLDVDGQARPHVMYHQAAYRTGSTVTLHRRIGPPGAPSAYWESHTFTDYGLAGFAAADDQVTMTLVRDNDQLLGTWQDSALTTARLPSGVHEWRDIDHPSPGELSVAFVDNLDFHLSYAQRDGDRWSSGVVTSTGRAYGVELLRPDDSNRPRLFYHGDHPRGWGLALFHAVHDTGGWQEQRVPTDRYPDDTHFISTGVAADRSHDLHVALVDDLELWHVWQHDGAWSEQRITSFDADGIEVDSGISMDIAPDDTLYVLFRDRYAEALKLAIGRPQALPTPSPTSPPTTATPPAPTASPPPTRLTPTTAPTTPPERALLPIAWHGPAR